MLQQNYKETATLPETMYASVAALIVLEVVHEVKYFDTPVHLLDVFGEQVLVYCICVSPDGRIYMVCNISNEYWDELCETDRNYSLVITALYNRLMAERRIAV